MTLYDELLLYAKSDKYDEFYNKSILDLENTFNTTILDLLETLFDEKNYHAIISISDKFKNTSYENHFVFCKYQALLRLDKSKIPEFLHDYKIRLGEIRYYKSILIRYHTMVDVDDIKVRILIDDFKDHSFTDGDFILSSYIYGITFLGLIDKIDVSQKVIPLIRRISSNLVIYKFIQELHAHWNCNKINDLVISIITQNPLLLKDSLMRIIVGFSKNKEYSYIAAVLECYKTNFGESAEYLYAKLNIDLSNNEYTIDDIKSSINAIERL